MLGTGVFGGMIATTIRTVILVPVFFWVLQALGENLSKGTKEDAQE